MSNNVLAFLLAFGMLCCFAAQAFIEHSNLQTIVETCKEAR